MVVVGADQRREHRGLELEALDVGSGGKIALQLADLDQVVGEDERGGEARDLEVLHQARALPRRPRCRPAAGRTLGVVAERRGREHVLLQPLAPGAPVGPEVDQDRLALGLGARARRGDVVEPTVAGRRRRGDRSTASRSRPRARVRRAGSSCGRRRAARVRAGSDQGRGLARDDTIRPPHETRSSTVADRRVRDDEGRAAGGRAQSAGHRRRELRSGRARLRIAGGGGRSGAPITRRRLHEIYGGDRARGSAARAARSLPPRVGRSLERAAARPRSRWAPRRPCSSSRSRWSTTATRSSSRRRAGCRSPTR